MYGKQRGIESDVWNEDGGCGDHGLTDHEELPIFHSRRNVVVLPALQRVLIVVQVEKDGLELDLNTAVIGGGGVVARGVQVLEDNNRLLRDARKLFIHLVDINWMITGV